MPCNRHCIPSIISILPKLFLWSSATQLHLELLPKDLRLLSNLIADTVPQPHNSSCLSFLQILLSQCYVRSPLLSHQPNALRVADQLILSSIPRLFILTSSTLDGNQNCLPEQRMETQECFFDSLDLKPLSQFSIPLFRTADWTPHKRKNKEMSRQRSDKRAV